MGTDFLGVGVSFPLRTEKGKLKWAEYEDSIKESINMILRTAKGERLMRPKFGCDLSELAFAKNDMSTVSLAIFYVEEALKEWEPRIELVKVDASPDVNDGSKLNIEIEYRTISTNNRYNLVYPFYLERG
ncbi:GPW/gp25 family protein [Methanosarcina sp.]|uniref:GPW/gp25 family protein n=1 Tax=Methanosarcina sp. TaxID=2213 RepID=UPI003C76354C